MLSRRPPASAPVAERLRALTGLTGAADGGWVPEVPPPAPRVPVVPDAGEASGLAGAPVVVDTGEASGLAGAPVVSEVPSLGRVLRAARLDPGRRGAWALAAVGLVAAVVAGALLLRGRPAEQPLVVPAVAGSSAAGRSAAARGGPEVVVDVAGRVRRPGLVRLPLGSRVDDALRAAGGLLPGTPPGLLNLARKLVDGEQVLVGAGPAPAGAGSSGSTAPGLLDLNTATAQDLDALPGIGPVLAERIVSWRTEHGGRFASVDQLREVDGIGEAKYSSLKAKVTV